MVEIDIKKHLKGSTFDLEIKTQISQNSIVCIYGSSGAGKTSLLRLITGLDTPTNGIIKVNTQTWFDSLQKQNLSPKQRNIGYVPQVNSLFLNMTVRQNLEFALLKNQPTSIISELLNILELKAFSDKRIDLLSGGEKQRVAIAQALVQKPKLLLLDEPFSAIDQLMTKNIQQYLLKIHKTFNLTIIFVSHQISDVFALADDVIQMEKGEIIKQGTPSLVFSNQSHNNSVNSVGIITSFIDNTYMEILIDNNKLRMPIPANTSFNIGDEIILESEVKRVSLVQR